MPTSIQHLFAPVNFDRGHLYNTSDLDQARLACAQVLNPHQIKVIAPRPVGFRARMDHLSVGHMSLSRLTWGTAVAVDPERLDTYYLLSLPTVGQAHFVLDGYETTVTPHCMGIVNPSQRFHFTTSQDFHQIVLRLEKSRVEQCWQGLTGQHPASPIVFSPGLTQSSSTWSAVEPMLRLLTRCAEPQASGALGSDNAFLKVRLEEMLIMALLLNQPHSHARQLALSPLPTTPKQLRHAKEFMVTHLDTPLRLTDVSLHVGASARHLQTLFQEAHQCGPMQWLKEQRLDAVRHALLSPQDVRERIADLALRYGFSHLGEFNRAYKKRFGVTPRNTKED